MIDAAVLVAIETAKTRQKRSHGRLLRVHLLEQQQRGRVCRSGAAADTAASRATRRCGRPLLANGGERVAVQRGYCVRPVWQTSQRAL